MRKWWLTRARVKKYKKRQTEMVMHGVLIPAHTVYSLNHAGCLPHLSSLPGSNVIILPAPTPVLVREAVHLHVLVWGHCRYPTKILWVWQPGRVTARTILKIMSQGNANVWKTSPTLVYSVLLPVSELIHGHRQVCGKLFVAGVGVVVVFRQQVNIMQEDAAPVFISECLPHPNV